jgi:hypothetical protein
MPRICLFNDRHTRSAEWELNVHFSMPLPALNVGAVARLLAVSVGRTLGRGAQRRGDKGGTELRATL